MAETTDETEQAPEEQAQQAGQEQPAPEASEPATAAEPQEKLTPKERRRRVRSTHSGPVGKPRSSQERHAQRLQERREKATRRSARRKQEREKAAKAPKGQAPADLAPVHEPKRGAPKERQGIVVSSKADKTITVRIDVARQHRRYEKIVRSSNTLHAHDENNEAHEGDTVRVIESRPLSRTKRWKLVEVLERAR